VLEALELDATDEAVYLAMVAEPGSGPAAIAQRLALPEARVRASADALVRLKLARLNPVTGTLRAVSPELGFGPFLRELEENLARSQLELAAARAAVAHAALDYLERRVAAGGSAEQFDDPGCVVAKLTRIVSTAGRECLSVLTHGTRPEAGIVADLLSADQYPPRPQVVLRVLCVDGIHDDPVLLGAARRIVRAGGQLRTALAVPPFLLVADRRIALVPADPADPRKGAVCTLEPGIIACLAEHFEMTWAAAARFSAEPVPAGEAGYSDRDRTLLRFLACGLTDETAASRLGVSVRTARRQMAVLMKRLGATSRFQAGVKAAQQGLL
jgi:DNA-binding CsgD family transcriptional regulator